MQDSRRPARPRAATLRDVATIAGVSLGTASKALNGREHVNEQTRLRVQEAAARISFIPNSVARGLLAGQTGTVGLLTNDLVGRLSLPILMGAEDAFGTGKMSVLLCDARGDPIRENYHLQALLQRRVDGLIVVGSSTDPRPSLGDAIPVPVVYVYGPSASATDHSLVPDSVGGAALATQHLLDLGRRNLLHITGDPDYLAARERADGVMRTLRAAQVELLGGEAIYGAWSEAWGRAATTAALRRFSKVDGIICGSDQIARGVLDALRENGVSVPSAVAVTGFDNWEVLASGARPQLTTVDMNLEKLGHRAAQQMFAALEGTDGAGIERLPSRLIVRGSTVPDA